MNLETAKLIIPALKYFEGRKSTDGYSIMKFLIAPRNKEKQMEFLNVYTFNKWDEHCLIADCYRGEDLTIIVQYDFPYPMVRYQSLRDFLLKRNLQ